MDSGLRTGFVGHRDLGQPAWLFSERSEQGQPVIVTREAA